MDRKLQDEQQKQIEDFIQHMEEQIVGGGDQAMKGGDLEHSGSFGVPDRETFKAKRERNLEMKRKK